MTTIQTPTLSSEPKRGVQDMYLVLPSELPGLEPRVLFLWLPGLLAKDSSVSGRALGKPSDFGCDTFAVFESVGEAGSHMLGATYAR